MECVDLMIDTLSNDRDKRINVYYESKIDELYHIIQYILDNKDETIVFRIQLQELLDLLKSDANQE